MKTRIAILREDPNSTNLDKLLNEEEFLSFAYQILKTSNTMPQMTIICIEEVGNVRALVLFKNQQLRNTFKLSKYCSQTYLPLVIQTMDNIYHISMLW